MTGKKITIIIVCVIVVLVVGVEIKKVVAQSKYKEYERIADERIKEQEKAEKEREEQLEKSEELKEIATKKMIEDGKKETIYQDGTGASYKVSINDDGTLVTDVYVPEDEENINISFPKELPTIKDDNNELEDEIKQKVKEIESQGLTEGLEVNSSQLVKEVPSR